jgi:hypothetical protein
LELNSALIKQLTGGSRPMSVQSFVGEVKKRYQVGRDYKLGTVIYGAVLSNL